MNRAAYMAADHSTPTKARNAHRTYYAQFVDSHVLAFVERQIGRAAILASTDEHFNDIPLARWDRLEPHMRELCLSKLGDVNGAVSIDEHGARRIAWSLSDAVCIAKEAARQIAEAAGMRGDWLVQSAPFGHDGPWTTIASYSTEEQADDCIGEIARTLPHEHFRTRRGQA